MSIPVTAPITPAQGQEILAANFAPWVQALNLQVLACDASSAQLRMPFDDKLVRVGGILCGQALMSAADTAMVIAISSALGGFKLMATVSQNVSFMRPVAKADVLITARVLKPGKTLVFGEIEMRAEGDERLALHATTTYAWRVRGWPKGGQKEEKRRYRPMGQLRCHKRCATLGPSLISCP